MDGSNNGFSKTLILIAVAFGGLAAGQFFLRQGSPISPQGPWGSAYPSQSPIVAYPPPGYSPPGYLPPGYAQPIYPQAGYGQPVHPPQGYGQPQLIPQGGLPPSMATYGPPSDQSSGEYRSVDQASPPRPKRTRTGSKPLQRVSYSTGEAQGDQLESTENGDETKPNPSSPNPAPIPAAVPQPLNINARIVKIIGDGLAWNEAALKLTPVVSDSFQIYVTVYAANDLIAAGFNFQMKIDQTPVTLDEYSPPSSPSTPLVGVDGTIKDFKNGIKKGEFTYGPFTVDGNSQMSPIPTGIVNAKLLFVSDNVENPVFNVTERSQVKIQFASPESGQIKVNAAATRYAPSETLSGTNPQSLFGGFLRIGGTAVDYRNVRIFLAKPTNNVSEIFTKLGADMPVSANGQWGNELDLSSLGNANSGTLLIIAQKSDGSVSQQQIKLLNQPVAPPGQVNISFKGVVKRTPDGVGINHAVPNYYYSNKGQLTFTAEVNGQAEQGQVALFQAGSNTPLATSPLSDATGGPLTLVPDTAFKEGDFALFLQVFQGGKSIAQTDQFVISIRTTGPYPVSVSPTNLAETPNLNVIRVRFHADNQLDTTLPTADAVTNAEFALTNINSTGAAPIPPTVLTFNSSDNSVEASYAPLAEGAYKLSIRGKNGTSSIKDLNGNRLRDGVYEFGVTKPIGSELSSSPTVGLKNSTGPNVAYPEFTEPRKSTVGFNPSDKVVTKIARLYYFRDAHRVVQLVNRDARSFNRQGVDVQQQLTDNARRQADDATGDRQAAERGAIQAASRARAAEQSLKQYQQGLIAARKQIGEVNLAADQQAVQQLDLENQLRDAQANTSAAQANVDTPSADPVILAKDQLTLAQSKTKEAMLQRSLENLNLKQQRNLTAQGDAQALVTVMEGHVSAAMAEVQAARNQEAEKRELSATTQFKEDRARADLFRREVAAAKEDPDTYAPGNPTSQDPMQQVSLSVIGEGIIQLRGPSKGVNLVRTLINQIDAPVGQVRIGIHSVQVNGEHGKRMEPVIGRIQLYVDHSRFLTVQSGQMLRNAVTLVASRCADQAMIECADQGQAARDQKYIAAFFGQEFLDELRTLDSEFLHTGNKLLSLHSMDSTSLANALFLLSLAKNDVRQQILAEFDMMVTGQLPLDEQEYFTASAEQYKFGPLFHKTKFQFLAHNAKFVSLKGFFNAEVVGAETLTPMQREFIRLAQIFKSRLVTELELQQRIMERSLIEDRIDNYADKQRAAKDLEDQANKNLQEQLASLQKNQAKVLGLAENIEAYAAASRSIAAKLTEMADGLKEMTDEVEAASMEKSLNFDENQIVTLNLKSSGNSMQLKVLSKNQWQFKAETIRFISAKLLDCGRIIETADHQLVKFNITQFDKQNLDRGRQQILDAIRLLQGLLQQNSCDKTLFTKYLKQLKDGIPAYVSIGKQVVVDAIAIRVAARDVVQYLGKSSPDVPNAIRRWVVVEAMIKNFVNLQEFDRSADLLGSTSRAFEELSNSSMEYEAQLRLAESSRRPLDHKKFLDMLIDDVEDKFIELMEGTRAHTAIIDNYLSRLGQALDDDFQTQFYNPAFKEIREAGRYWDVQMGQIETTTVLTNNRMFAKVSPQATMEFDLPKRSILLTEAMRGVMTAYDDYGALLGDPNFLALTKMHGGQAASAIFNRDNSSPTVRSVLPGLPSAGNESLIAQSGAASPDFPSALESLIPDPAIYKFETGTGYEIRPVIQPDGQAVVFHFNYMYTTNIREPVRADEKHLGRVKRHFIDTDVQTGNYELREVSRYQVALKASRTSRGVPFLEDLPGAGILFRPLPNQESSLQQNLILAQTVIFPTLYDLMGLRWAPVVADLDALRLQEADFVTRSRQRSIRERVFDYSSQQVDEFLRIPAAERRTDLYRSQESTPLEHPNGYMGRGLKMKDGTLREGYRPETGRPDAHYVPGSSAEGAVGRGGRSHEAFLQESSSYSPPNPTTVVPHHGEMYETNGLPASRFDSMNPSHDPGSSLENSHFDRGEQPSLPSPPTLRSPTEASEDEQSELPPLPQPPQPGIGRSRSLFKSPFNRVANPTGNSAIQLQSYQSETPSQAPIKGQNPQTRVAPVPQKSTSTTTTKKGTPNESSQLSPVNRPESKSAGGKLWNIKRMAVNPAASKPITPKPITPKPITEKPITEKPTAKTPAESNSPPALLPATTRRHQGAWRKLEGTAGDSQGLATARTANSQGEDPPVTISKSEPKVVKYSLGSHDRPDSQIVQVKAPELEPTSKTQKVLNRLSIWPKKQ